MVFNHDYTKFLVDRMQCAYGSCAYKNMSVKKRPTCESGLQILRYPVDHKVERMKTALSLTRINTDNSLNIVKCTSSGSLAEWS